MTIATKQGPGGVVSGKAGDGASEVQVHMDYISAEHPIHQKFPDSTLLVAVKEWARSVFVPNPPSDKAFYVTDDKTRHRFTPEEEQMSLSALGYEHVAHLRLNEEQISG